MESEQQQGAQRRRKDVIEKLRYALEEKRLVVVVGAGVTLHATSDPSGTPLPRLTWTGLIRDGLDYLVQEGLVETSSRSMWQAYDLLNDNTPGSYLDAASYMTRHLRQNGKFSTWLDSVFGNLDREVRYPAILEALRSLFQQGAMLLTTNYDDLLEKTCQSPYIGRSDRGELLRFKRGELKGILHLHGSHHYPNEIVMDGSDYDVITHSDEIQNILRELLEYKVLLFVGCGSGLDDPNFGTLLKWAFDRQQNIPHRHCLLVRNEDTLKHKFLVRLEYGSSYENLAPFLKSLLPLPVQRTEETLHPGFANSVPQVSNVSLGPRPVFAADQRKNHLASLRFSQMDARHLNIKNALAQTCTWLLSKSQYLDWLDVDKVQEHHGFLWIKGKPGTGKSTITKFAFAHAHRSMTDSIVISFFFNARGENLEKSTVGMYRSLLWQLLEKVPRLHFVLDSLEPMPENLGDYRLWDLQLIKELFRQAVEELGHQLLTCFIDALDESEEDQIRDMVAFFENIGQSAVSSQSRLLVCFSSRPYPHITIKNSVELVLEDQKGHQEDITKYLHSELKAGRSKLVEQIKSEIVERASGIFLWVVLVVQMLNKEYDRGRIHALRQRLNEIPNGLKDLFNDILVRDGQNMKELILCLRWILYAKRPLRCEELYYAMLISLEPQHVNKWKSDEITIQDIERYLLNYSKGLAEVTKSRVRTVQFIHESVRDFLLNGRALDKLQPGIGNNFPGLSHEELKRSCQEYMEVVISAQSPFIATSNIASSNVMDSRQVEDENFPFLEYAVHGVLHHADAAQHYGVLQDDFVQHFPLGKWITLSNAFERYKIRQYTKNASLLYILANENFPDLIRIELRQIKNMDVSGERYGYPVLAALTRSNEAAVRALLMPFDRAWSDVSTPQVRTPDSTNTNDQGAFERFIQDSLGLTYPKDRTLLSRAIRDNNVGLVKILLNTQKVDVNVLDNTSRRTPLLWAAAGGYDMVVKLLLDTEKVDVNVLDNTSRRTPLSWAAAGGYDTVVKLLLNIERIDPDIKDKDSRTPLSWAAAGGHDIVVKLLLDTERVNPDIKDNNNRTALLWAAAGDHDTVVKLFLNTEKIDSDIKHEVYRDLLLWAAAHNNDTVVKLLFNIYHIDPNVKDMDGRTPLSRAAIRGHNAMVKLLLNIETVDSNAKDQDGRTPLWLAAAAGAEEVVKILLTTHTVDPNAKDNDGCDPLWAAAERGAIDVVQIISAATSVDTSATDTGGCTLLSRLVRQVSPVRDLLPGNNALADFQMQLRLLEQQNKKRLMMARQQRFGFPYTLGLPLVITSQEVLVKIVDLLLKTGIVDPNAKDTDGRTPFQLAAVKGATEMVDMLAEAGSVNIGLKDQYEDALLNNLAQQVSKVPSLLSRSQEAQDYQNKRRRLMAEVE